MIRKWHSENTAQLLRMWLESTTEAHPFIDADYWKANEALVRDEYLPAAETWVWEENGTPRGFISVIQSQFVGALFVTPAYIGKGIGRALLNHVQQRFPHLELGRSLVSTLTAPFLQIPPSVGSRSGQAP